MYLIYTFYIFLGNSCSKGDQDHKSKGCDDDLAVTATTVVASAIFRTSCNAGYDIQ